MYLYLKVDVDTEIQAWYRLYISNFIICLATKSKQLPNSSLGIEYVIFSC